MLKNDPVSARPAPVNRDGKPVRLLTRKRLAVADAAGGNGSGSGNGTVQASAAGAGKGTRVLTLDTFEHLPPVKKADERTEAVRWCRLSAAMKKADLAAQVMSGIWLDRVYEKFAVKRGGAKPGAGRPSKSGEFKPKRLGLNSEPDEKPFNWEAFCKEECGICDETAHTRRAMAQEAKKRLKKLKIEDAEITFEHLFELPIEAWSDQELELVTKVVAKLTDSKSQMDFLEELGLTAKQGKTKGGNTGGGRGNAPNPEDPAEIASTLLYEPLMEIAKDWHSQEQDAPLWTHLTDAHRRKLDDLLLEMRQGLLPSSPETPEAGKTKKAVK